MDKEDGIYKYLYNGKLLSHKRIKSCHLQQHGWAGGHYVKWNKSGRESIWYHIYVESKKIEQTSEYDIKKSRFTDTQTSGYQCGGDRGQL